MSKKKSTPSQVFEVTQTVELDPAIEYEKRRIAESRVAAACLAGWVLRQDGIMDPSGKLHSDVESAVPRYDEDMQLAFTQLVPKLKVFILERQGDLNWQVTYGSDNQVMRLTERSAPLAVLIASATIAHATGKTRTAK